MSGHFEYVLSYLKVKVTMCGQNKIQHYINIYQVRHVTITIT